MSPNSSAFSPTLSIPFFPRSLIPSLRLPRSPLKRIAAPRAVLPPPQAELPVGTIIAAGVSVGILSATFESMLNVLYKCPRHPSDDELCEFCSGFGNVRCEICGSRGVVPIVGTSVLRKCPVCKGKKWERCRRCIGTGKSGMKKSHMKARTVDVDNYNND